MAFGDYFRGRRVLVTGHTGFKGAWLSLWLSHLGAEVHGLALPPEAGLYAFIRDNTFARESFRDLRERASVRAAIGESRPSLIFHLAAQAIVQASYRDPVGTFGTNALGTVHLLDAVRELELSCDVVIITSDKCYENSEWPYAYRENDRLGGDDVYSMSKAAAELVAAAWYRSFFLTNAKLGHVVTARAGNVIGGGDFAEHRILPDCARALAAGRKIEVRNPSALRPWQHVLDCLSGYLWLATRIAGEGKQSPLVSPFNFGPTPHDFRSVRELVEEFLRHWQGEWTSVAETFEGREAGRLRLAIDKATELLDWQPTWSFAEAVRQSARWYRAHAASIAPMRELTLHQIAEFEHDAVNGGLTWAAS